MRRGFNASFSGKVYIALVLVFLYAPIVVMAVMSFNSSPFYTLPVDWTFDWYVKLANNDKLVSAGFNSFAVAIATTLIATVIGTLAALAFFRYEFPGKAVLQVLLIGFFHWLTDLSACLSLWLPSSGKAPRNPTRWPKTPAS